MTVRVLNTGNLTPQQVLVSVLNDPNLDEITSLVVVSMTKDGAVLINHSCCLHSEKAFMALLLNDFVVKAAYET